MPRVMRSLPHHVPAPKSRPAEDSLPYGDPDTTDKAGRHALKHGRMAEDMGGETQDGPMDDAEGMLDDEPLSDDENQGASEYEDPEADETDSPEHEAEESPEMEASEHDAHPGSPAARRPEPPTPHSDSKERKHGFMKYVKEGHRKALHDKGGSRNAGRVSHRGRSAGDAASALLGRKHMPMK